MKQTFPGREFQFWAYSVSHGSLLLRSPRNDDNDTNIDIVAVGVEYVDLPRHLKEIVLSEPTDGEIAFLSKKLKNDRGSKKIMKIESGSNVYFILAAGYQVAENDMDIFDLPF